MRVGLAHPHLSTVLGLLLAAPGLAEPSETDTLLLSSWYRTAWVWTACALVLAAAMGGVAWVCRRKLGRARRLNRRLQAAAVSKDLELRNGLPDDPLADEDLPPADTVPANSILVVDDEPVNRLILRRQLTAAGYRVHEAVDGPQALEKLAEDDFDLVLLDVMMPGMSGYEVCRELRQRFAAAHYLPIIFLTARNRVSDVVEGFSSGGNDYLTKPVVKDELLVRVANLLALRDAHRLLASVAEERGRLVLELRQRNAELARFNDTVSHDLRNPLCTLKNFLGLLRRDAERGASGQVARDLEVLEGAAEEMEERLEELYEYSRLGRERRLAATLAADDLVAEAARRLAGPLAERGVELRVASGLPTVDGDRAHLIELFEHLLDNAMKFMGEEPRPGVDVAARLDGDEAVFSIADNGMGVPKRYQDKIFNLFEQLDAGTRGAGMGLAIARRIVEHHGGRIWIESDGEGHGSTVRFTLPGAAKEISSS